MDTSMKMRPPGHVHSDERGHLVPLELDTVPFEARRVFVVQGPDHRVTRGGHQAGSHQVLLLVAGRAELRVRALDGSMRSEKLVAGESVELEATDWIDYDLVEPHSVLLVIASEPYSMAREGAVR